MAPDIRLEKYVQRKLQRGKEYFFFRVVRKGEKEFRRPLPFPLSTEYRRAYDAAHTECFGAPPLDLSDPLGFQNLINRHRTHARYLKLSSDSKTLRDLAADLLLETFGAFRPSDIRPLHMQALYDKLSERPATANRRMDDMSAIFAWGRTRGFCDQNPCTRIERVKSEGSYEPWPTWALEKLFKDGKPHIVKASIAAIYTGQRRADCLTQLRPAQIEDGIWIVKQGKTKTTVPVPLHPVVLAMIDTHNEENRLAGRIDRETPVLKNSRGQPWGSGFGASWSKELVRLKLHTVSPRLTFHGFRTTNATMIASAVAKSPDLFGGFERVQSMLGHLSERMAKHYARRAVTEHTNAETILLLPEIGKHSG
jgi:Phage integrase family